MKKSLFKSTVIFSSMTVVSRLTGFLRELVCAHLFGASIGFDAYVMALRIPNFLRRIFAEGAFSQGFVPILSEYHQKRSVAETQAFLNHMAGLMLGGLFVFTVIAVLIAPLVVYLLAPGYAHDANKFMLTTSMLRITFPYIMFVSLTAYVTGILNTYGKFGIPAFTPNILNLTLIGAALFLAPYFAEPPKALAWGILLGGVAQLIFQLPSLYKLNLMPRPSILWQDAGVRRVLNLMAPAILGVSIAPLGYFIDTIFASFLQAGSVSWLYYSDRLTSLPLGVFGVAIATVVLPHLSRNYTAASPQEFSATLDWALRFVLVLACPATLGLALLAGPILVTLFLGGKFTVFDIMMAKRSLLGFVAGIPAFMLVKVLASGFYSRQDIKTPVKIAIVAIVANLIFAAILVVPLAHAGLALATSLASMLNALLLFWQIWRRKYYMPSKGWGVFWGRVGFANIMLALALWLVTARLPLWFAWNVTARIWHLALLCGGAVFLYVMCLWLSGMKLQEFIFQEK